MKTTCTIFVYRTKKLKGYFNLGDTVSKYKEVGKMGHLIAARDEATTNEHIRLPLYFSLVWREPYTGMCFKYCNIKTSAVYLVSFLK